MLTMGSPRSPAPCRTPQSIAPPSWCVAGVGALLLAKLDIESAYRIAPIHPDDRSVLGMKWKDEIYIDTCLPFGLRSAPKIFTALADALGWIFTQHGVRDVIHYLDDFLIVGDPGSSECSVALNVALELCGRYV